MILSYITLIYLFGPLAALTPNLKDSSVELLANYLNLTLKFKEYIPKCVISEIEDLLNPENERELQTIVKLNGAIQSGDINLTMPFTKEELSSILEQHAPELHNRTVRIFEDFKYRYSHMSPEAQKFWDEGVAHYYSMHENSKNTSVEERIVGFIKFMQEEDARYFNSTLPVKVEYFKQFPEVLKFMKSPVYKQLRNIVNSVETSKLAGVLEKFFKILKISFS